MKTITMDYNLYRIELVDAKYEGVGLKGSLQTKLRTYLDVIRSGIDGTVSREAVLKAHNELLDLLVQLEKNT